MHTVSSQDFRSLSVFLILLSKVPNKFMELEKKTLNGESLEVRVAISRKKYFFKICFVKFMLDFLLIASNCATVRESVFKIEFRVLAGEFESIETSPGFARLLDEN